MKRYIISEEDLERLITSIDRDPEHGHRGGSFDSSVNDPGKRTIYSQAHRFYNYQVRQWIHEIKQP